MYWNKPVIAAVVEGEISRILRASGAGITVKPNNPKALADAVRFYTAQKDPKTDSRQYLMRHFDRNKIVDNFVTAMLSL